jgi:hypothetical protein
MNKLIKKLLTDKRARSVASLNMLAITLAGSTLLGWNG